GDGWRWESEKRLSISGLPGVIGSSVTRTTGDGYQATYTWGLTGYQSAEGSGAHDTIVLAPALLLLPAEWVWTDGSTRAVERYDLNGRLKSHTNANGETTTYTYDGSGRLTSVKDSSGQELVMVYNAGGKLQRLDTRTTSGGPLTRQVYYAYDTAGRLTSVTTDLTPADNSIADGQVYTTSYTYDGSSFRIASISQSDGTSAAYTYQLVAGDYRVATVTDASGTTTFSYDTTNRRTDVTNGLGQVWSYHYDAAGQLIQVQTPSVTGSGRLSTHYAYDSQGNVTSITDGLGNTVTYEYDSRGNRTRERDALGNTVRRTYNSNNQLSNEITYSEPATFNGTSWSNPPNSSDQTTRFIYDNKSNLRYVIDATGAVTENRYSSSGLRLAQIRYVDATFSSNGLLALDIIDEALL
ncbi:MAG: RHS repeat protein, partial [Acinetobacter sp.]|nr:RHS repeat protein [Acinetobacter sp.]